MNETSGARLHGLLQTYYQAWFRYHPEAAVDAGVPGYAHRLTPCDEESAGALVCLNDELQVALDEVEEGALSPDDRLDLTLVRGAAAVENQRLLDVDPRRVDPQRWLPLNALYQLTVRPVAEFDKALSARLEAVPGHLASARDYLVPRAAQVPALWLGSTVISARAGIDFLRGLPACPKWTKPPAGLDATLERAVRSLNEFVTFLEKDVAPTACASVACGKAHFTHLLREHHGLDITLDELRTFGAGLVERTRRELRAVCRELTGSEESKTVLAQLRARHPTADGLLAAYRDGMRAARDFVAARGLATLPAVEALDVVDTPAFLRNQIPFAAYYDPAPNDPDQRGLYYVTPPANAEQLAEHDVVGLRHTCVHEAWPGHHMQFVTANRSAVSRTLPRVLNASATLYEGWALYSEQLMYEQGFLDRPESRFILLRDRLWRALRVLIDIDLHCRGLNEDEAAQRLVNELDFPMAQARAEITWYSRAPTVPLGYATGWAVINAVRERWRADNPDATLRDFHDRLLSVGSIALTKVVEHAFGGATRTVAREQVFEGGRA